MTRVKPILKRVARAIAVVLVCPLILAANLERWSSTSETWFSCCAESLSLVPGKIGNYLRVAFYRFTLEACSTEMLVLFGAKMSHRTARIRHDVHIGSWACIGTATVGDHVLISSRVSILSGNKQHNVSDPGKNITEDPPRFERVHIGSNTFIGEGAILLADVGSRCVIAAGSVVFQPVPDGKVVMGNPARVMFPNPAVVSS